VITITNDRSIAEVGEDGPAMNEAIKEALDFSEEAKSQWKMVAQARIANLVARRKKQLNLP
jgi:hypothetical protein